MKGRWKKAGILVLGLLLLTEGCRRSEQRNVFTNEKPEQFAFQPLLNVITPAAYGTVEGISVPPGSYISIIGKQSDSSYWNTVRSGVLQAGDDLNKALGYEGSDRVKVVYNAPDKGEDVDEQVNILDEELDRNPSALGIASIDESASAVQFDIAVQNQIPLVALDSGNLYQGIESVCRTDNREAARTAAYKMADEIGGGGSVIIVAHDHVSQTAKDRTDGFTEELQEKYPDITVTKILYMDELDKEKEEIAAVKEGAPEDIKDEDVFAYYMENTKDVRGLFGTNSMCTEYMLRSMDTIPADRNTSAMDKKKVIVGFDGGKYMLDQLKNGRIKGLILQNPFGMGYASVIAACRAVSGTGNEAVVDTGYTWVTKDNIDTPSIASMLYGQD